ncbi:MAG: hypothetical protein ABSC76_06730 [Terracidiphilus sp.]|jgi:hypothetical protein
MFKSIAFPAMCLTLYSVAFSQERQCPESSVMGKMAGANSVAGLKAWKIKAGDSYRAQVIFAARMLEVDPTNRSMAELLLNLIPKDSDDPHQAVWLELDELSQCSSGGGTTSELKALDLLQYHLPRLLARAVLLVPNHMTDYVTYAEFALTPESDYALQMQRVCKREHRKFRAALDSLPVKDIAWFKKEVINPENCKALYFPEQ